MITSSDLQKIELYIKENAVKDSDFTKVDTVNNDDTIVIVQNGSNKRVEISVLKEGLVDDIQELIDLCSDDINKCNSNITKVSLRTEYLENISRKNTMNFWHTIIDYTKKFELRASGSTVVARFAVNPYNTKPLHQFIIPSYYCSEDIKVTMKICSDAACTNVIAEEGDLVEFAAGTYVYVKYDLYYNLSVLGNKIVFAARDNYGDYRGDTIATLSPITLFCESDYVTPNSGDIKVHSLGGVLTAAGKLFGSDYKYLSKLTVDGISPSGGGNIDRQRTPTNNFTIHVNSSLDNSADTINIRVESNALDVKVSTETSPKYKMSVEDVVYLIQH